MKVDFIATAGRWIFGLFYAAVGVWVTLGLLGFAAPPQQPTPSAAAFTAALSASGIIDPLLALTYLSGGFALLSRRTAPLGIILLAPAVAVIFLFHIRLSGQWIWGSVNLLWLGALAWYFRHAFVSLWNYRPSGAVS